MVRTRFGGTRRVVEQFDVAEHGAVGSGDSREPAVKRQNRETRMRGHQWEGSAAFEKIHESNIRSTKDIDVHRPGCWAPPASGDVDGLISIGPVVTRARSASTTLPARAV